MSVVSHRKRKNIVIILISVAFIIFLQWFRIRHVDKSSFLQGLLSAVQFAICILIVKNNPKKGLLLSMVWLVYNIGSIIHQIVVFQNRYSMAGFVSSLVYLVTIVYLSNLLAVEEKEINTDSVTGLLNRNGILQYIQDAIDDKSIFSVVRLRMDNFRIIKDNYGHDFGQKLLVTVSDFFNQNVGKKSALGIIGSDEFIWVIKDAYDAEVIAKYLNEKAERKFVIENKGSPVEVFINYFCGISKFPEDASNGTDLLQYADIAMYRAVTANREKAVIYKEEMSRALERKVEVDKLIRIGLEKKWFYMVFQPQYKLNGKVLRGFESLIRMKTDEGFFVSPADFIPVAEQSELIFKIDEYVMRLALTEFKEILKINPDLICSINISAQNICRPDFAQRVFSLINELEYPAKNLEVEITEYCFSNDINVTIKNIELLREAGIQVALDDFGTGYSSLQYLTKIPVSLLKIDKSLVDEIEFSEKSLDFFESVVYIGHRMGCEVISEGVESTNQLKFLAEKNCDLVQGYIWGKPLPFEEAKKLSDEQKKSELF